MSHDSYSAESWAGVPRSRPTLFQWMLEHTALGETEFGQRHVSYQRRSTFQSYSRMARASERRLLQRLNS